MYIESQAGFNTDPQCPLEEPVTFVMAWSRPSSTQSRANASNALEFHTASFLQELVAPPDAGPVDCSSAQLCVAPWAWRELRIEPILRCKILPSLYQFSRKEGQ